MENLPNEVHNEMHTDSHKKLYNCVTSHGHHAHRVKGVELPSAEDYCRRGVGVRERMVDRFERMCRAEGENAVILEGQAIVFIRTVPPGADVVSAEEWAAIKKDHFVHELGYMSNVCPDYISVIKTGFAEARKGAEAGSRRCIDALSRLAEKYRERALEAGRGDVAAVLARVPEMPAVSFREALQFFRILHYGLWLEGEYHNTVGRFDLFMSPFLRRDIERGALSEDEAYALVRDFFMSFNIDSDMYPGIQQGDNGQSIMLGGVDSGGAPVRNTLTDMCLRASAELKLIDPKINLRVSSETPLEVFEAGTRLTAIGLGFPQYSNDDAVIDGLVALGYERADAANYTVAACWEFIIPGDGADVVNIAALSYPSAVDKALRKHLARCADCADFDALLGFVDAEIAAECGRIAEKVRNLWFVPAPFMDVLFGNTDISKGAKYNNYGIHGTGISCAADSLAALKKHVFDQPRYTPEELLRALDNDFAGSAEMLNMLRHHSPKVGADDDEADRHLAWLASRFAAALRGKKNDRGGGFRAGTGSAMYYLWHAAEIGASPDGRRANEPFGTNFSPGLNTKITDCVSVVNSFTKPDLRAVINGGPLTLEFHADIFNNSEGAKKVAQFVRYFIQRGGHQIQLNSVDRGMLLDAQKNPDKYRNLIVRIWGWSAYFTELDKEYQDHVIARNEYTA